MMKRIGLTIDERAAGLAGDALRGEALRRRRAAEKFSGELEADRAEGRVKDIRTGALQVVKLLAEADSLERAAEALEEAWSEQPWPEASGGHEQRLAAGEDPSLVDDEEPPARLPDPADDPDVVAAQILLADPPPAVPLP